MTDQAADAGTVPKEDVTRNSAAPALIRNRRNGDTALQRLCILAVFYTFAVAYLCSGPDHNVVLFVVTVTLDRPVSARVLR